MLPAVGSGSRGTQQRWRWASRREPMYDRCVWSLLRCRCGAMLRTYRLPPGHTSSLSVTTVEVLVISSSDLGSCGGSWFGPCRGTPWTRNTTFYSDASQKMLCTQAMMIFFDWKSAFCSILLVSMKGVSNEAGVAPNAGSSLSGTAGSQCQECKLWHGTWWEPGLVIREPSESCTQS